LSRVKKHIAIVADSLGDVFGVSLFKPALDQFGANGLI